MLNCGKTFFLVLAGNIYVMAEEHHLWLDDPMDEDFEQFSLQEEVDYMVDGDVEIVESLRSTESTQDQPSVEIIDEADPTMTCQSSPPVMEEIHDSDDSEIDVQLSGLNL
jgi:hypothetical protein